LRTVGIKRQVTSQAKRNVNTTANQPVPLGSTIPRDLRELSRFISQFKHYCQYLI
jgi:hypothetical protein